MALVVLERMPEPGRKLLLSGSGEASRTHEGDIASFLDRYGDHGRFLRHVLRAFPNTDLAAWFAARGVPLEGALDGKVFPASHTAEDVLGALRAACCENGVRIACGARVRMLDKGRRRLGLQTDAGTWRAGAVVLAMGVVPGHGLDRGRLPARPRARSYGRGPASCTGSWSNPSLGPGSPISLGVAIRDVGLLGRPRWLGRPRLGGDDPALDPYSGISWVWGARPLAPHLGLGYSASRRVVLVIAAAARRAPRLALQLSGAPARLWTAPALLCASPWGYSGACSLRGWASGRKVTGAWLDWERALPPRRGPRQLLLHGRASVGYFSVAIGNGQASYSTR